MNSSNSTKRNAQGGGSVGLTLDALVKRIGSGAFEVHLPSSYEGILVERLEIFDSSSPARFGEGTVLGLVSAESLPPEVLDGALDEAETQRCAGVAFKAAALSNGPVLHAESNLVEAILERGLPALIVSRDTAWRELDVMISRALGETAETIHAVTSTGDRLSALADAVAREFGGSVAIENHRREILAHSSVFEQAIDELRTTGILFRKAGEAPVNEQRYQSVLASEGIVRFPRYRNYLPRAAIAIRAGAIPLGTIWVVDPNGDDPDHQPLATAKSEILVRSAELVADAMLETWYASARTESRRESALRRVLIGSPLSGDVESLGPTDDSSAVMLVCSIGVERGAAARTAEVRRALDRHLFTYVADCAMAIDSREIIVMSPTDRVGVISERTEAALEEVSMETLSSIRVGLSDPHPIATRLPFAYDEARQVCRYVRSAKTRDDLPEAIGTVQSVRSALFFAACLNQLERDDRLVFPEVRDLLESKAENAHLIDTFMCWMQENGSVSQTARILRVHEQTVRYRIRRFKSLLEPSHEQDRLLAIWAQLRMFMSVSH